MCRFQPLPIIFLIASWTFSAAQLEANPQAAPVEYFPENQGIF
jgi:hypothetical protein